MQLLKQLLEMSRTESTVSRDIISRMFHKIGINATIVWSTHFLEDLIDLRPTRQDNISQQELINAFSKVCNTYGKKIWLRSDPIKDRYLIQDTETLLNIVVQISLIGENRYRIVGVTVMRKDPRAFKSDNFSHKLVATLTV